MEIINIRSKYPKCKICHKRIYDDVDVLFDHLENFDKINLNDEDNKILDSTAICEKYFDYS